MRRVVFVTTVITHYRAPFHERVRSNLASLGISYELVHSAPQGAEAVKQDTISLPWATVVPAKHWFGGRAVWQSIWPLVREAELVVLGQENRLLHNYILQILPRAFRPRLALWGHGRNFQARIPSSHAERWKRYWARRADWWFGYTNETRSHVEGLGFPRHKITVFNNTIDTSEMRRLATTVSYERQEERRHELGLVGKNVAIFVGGLYPDKRLAFLVEAAVRVRSRLTDFELIIVGSGTELSSMRALAERHQWIKILGPRFGIDKVELMSLAHLFLMPGLLGLAILDAAVMGLPTITTDYPWHSPEIAYLKPGVTGVKVSNWKDAGAYSDAIITILRDQKTLNNMAEAARAVGRTLTIEAMADKFTAGLLDAIKMVP